MGKSSGGAPQMMMMPSQQTTSNQLPQWVQDAGKANYDAASNMTPQAFQPYSFNYAAPLNEMQNSVISKAMNNIGASDAAYQQAAGMTQNALTAANNQYGAAANALANVDTSALRNSIAALNNAAQMGYNQVQASGNPLDQAFQYITGSYNPAAGGVRSVAGAQDMIGAAYNPVYQATNPAMQSLRQSVDDARGLQGFEADRVSAQSLPQGDIASYMNPYTEQVINTSLNALDRQRQNALNEGADAAIRSRAFGGSRQALQDAITNSQFATRGAELAANLQNQNFQQAQQALQADQARRLQADLANQSAGIQGAGVRQNAAQLTGQLANTLGGLGLNAGQFGVTAANTLGNLGIENAGLGITAGQNLGQLGLSARGQDISAQSANQNAALQNQANAIGAYQNAGSLGNAAANIGLNQARGMADIAGAQGQLGLSGAGQIGDLATAQQNSYLNSLNAGLTGANLAQQNQQALIDADRQRYNDWQQSMIAPLNLRMTALGQTPYNTSTSSSGFTTSPYQPTSRSPLSTALGAGLGGLSMLGMMSNPATAIGGGVGLLGSLGRMATGTGGPFPRGNYF